MPTTMPMREQQAARPHHRTHDVSLVAPSAMRMANSCDRRDTAYAITPYTPMATSNRPTAAKVVTMIEAEPRLRVEEPLQGRFDRHSAGHRRREIDGSDGLLECRARSASASPDVRATI